MQPPEIRFTKMHGLGNDFVVINNLTPSCTLKQTMITQLANRHIGIGFDQLLLLEPSNQADFSCRIFNADGSEAEQCGNGLRCVARFIHETGLHKKSSLTLETKAGIFPIYIQDYDHIRVSMGVPIVQEMLTTLTLKPEMIIPISVLSLGNPHAIVKMDNLLGITKQLGSAIATHTYFPEGANVGFMQVINPKHVRLRTFERGVGETYACGSNACAAAVAGIINGWLQAKVTVEFQYGSLLIEWEGNDYPIQMTGPATNVFSGQVIL